MSSHSEVLDAVFLDGSPLAAHLSGFAPRGAQREMARLVADAMATGRHLAVEAGAGTGKTLAYLVPALLSGQRVIIATGTRTLQDQLYHRDLPVVSRALGRPAVVAELKGRANYLCRYRQARAAAAPQGLGASVRRDLGRVTAWAARTQSGDIGEVSAVAEDSAVWPLVTSTVENCLGARCPDIEACHVFAARKRAAAADIAVVNHHLLLADMALQDGGFGSLLPGADTVVVDEAHRFADTAHAQFDVSLTSGQLQLLVRDTAAEAVEAGLMDAEMSGHGAAVLRQVAEALATSPSDGEPVAMESASPAFAESLAGLAATLEAWQPALAARRDASPGLQRCAERLANSAGAAARVANWQTQTDLCWVRGGREAFAVHLTPIDASGQLRNLLERQPCAWIFTSATLAVADDFSHFTGRLGLADLEAHRIPSPFDYERCTRLYLPQGLPSPDAADYTDRFVAAVEPVLQASRGRAFILFTSRRAMQRAADVLSGREHGHTLLVQGSAPRTRLLDEFSRAGNAVLLGTATFWEGVDIRGPALVVVAIDRLPFASPGDPFLQARLELIRRRDGDPFREYQLPQAVLTLRQGIGRLIRDASDYGVVIIGDPRLTQRGYGRVFLRSLPPLPVVRTAEEACAFLHAAETAR